MITGMVWENATVLSTMKGKIGKKTFPKHSKCRTIIQRAEMPTIYLNMPFKNRIRDDQPRDKELRELLNIEALKRVDFID